MNIQEVAGLLGCSREIVATIIEDGLQTPASKRLVRLAAAKLQSGYDVTNEDLDAYLAAFEVEEPGRHPPVAVRRKLLIESGYKCAVCIQDAPIEFHHMVEFSVVKHHDPQMMLAVCAGCHAKITRFGIPDATAQKEIKRRLQERSAAAAVAAVNPEDIRAIVAEEVQRRSHDLPSLAAASSEPILAIPSLAFAGAALPAAVPTRAAPPPAPNAAAVGGREALMRRLFSVEITFRGPSSGEIEWVAEQLFRPIDAGATSFGQGCVVLLRTMRAINQIQRINFPDAPSTSWTDTARLLLCSQSVLAEVGVDLLELEETAEAALRFCRSKNMLQFKEVDEWRPGMVSGSGWVEKTSLSLVGEKVLERAN